MACLGLICSLVVTPLLCKLYHLLEASQGMNRPTIQMANERLKDKYRYLSQHSLSSPILKFNFTFYPLKLYLLKKKSIFDL